MDFNDRRFCDDRLRYEEFRSWPDEKSYSRNIGNLGFRHVPGVRHILLINRRLYDTLCLTDAFAGLRYDLPCAWATISGRMPRFRRVRPPRLGNR